MPVMGEPSDVVGEPSADASAVLTHVLERLGATARRDVSLASMCTYKVGGSAAGYVDVGDVATLEAVRAALEGVDRTLLPVLLVGRALAAVPSWIVVCSKLVIM